MQGHEIFILWDVITESQKLSQTIASSVSHLAVHNPIAKWHGLISGVAFPYSPSEIDRPPSVPMTMRHWPHASLDLGAGEQHRGYAQQSFAAERRS